MKVEVFHAAGCQQCAAAQADLKAAAQRIVADLDWQDINVLEQIDRAVELGVFALPAVVIDGEVVFASSLPSPRQLGKALRARAGSG